MSFLLWSFPESADRAHVESENQGQEGAVPTYAARHGLTPEAAASLTDMQREEHVSDEASGPEDGSGETKANWNGRMARVAGIDGISPAALKKTKFLEVLKQEWCSDQVSRTRYISIYLSNLFQAYGHRPRARRDSLGLSRGKAQESDPVCPCPKHWTCFLLRSNCRSLQLWDFYCVA
jgi:hypothetical protein